MQNKEIRSISVSVVTIRKLYNKRKKENIKVCKAHIQLRKTRGPTQLYKRSGAEHHSSQVESQLATHAKLHASGLRGATMSLAHPPPPPHLRDGVLPAAGRFPSVPGCLGSRGILRCYNGGRVARAYCLFSGGGNRKKQAAELKNPKALLESQLARNPIKNPKGTTPYDTRESIIWPIAMSLHMQCERCEEFIKEEARKALESAMGQNKTNFEKWDVQIERRQQRGQPRGPAAGSGGWSGGGGWFRWFTSGGFWDAGKQTVHTILGIIAAIFLIANFNAMIAAVVNSLLGVLRQLRRLLSFIVQCALQSASIPRSGPKSSNLDSSNLTGVPVKAGVEMSAKERVVRKWGMD
ncbi:hypothetical protein PR202_gb23376 [Eleusine coracana subsp. coracana]|uniref:Uncharacterized protein n=1 Tax=Eleusine coracana subsp. coracana TaxID=191504 RepID=A0AAV5FJR5_ELECO|nr:hypothetical protein PR202_gb23376 [Eleusine coracana subsp. coracana]